MSGQRLVGVRTPYAEMPAELRTWVDEQVGSPVVETIARTGGMSPAVAATVVAADGTRAFVKAVSADINPDTPTHFRHETAVLSALGPAPYRADLLAAYDDDHWVAMLLQDVDGDHPDWHDDRAVDAVFDAVVTQADELTPVPAALRVEADQPGTVSDVLAKHQKLILADPPDDLFRRLPDWAQADYTALMSFVNHAPPLDGDTLCHFDIRHDNLLVRRSDGQVVTLDWGMSRRGPWWGDIVVMALEWAELDRFDALLERGGLGPDDERDATRLLTSLGCFLTMSSAWPAPPGLPHLPRFRYELGSRCLEGVRRRLGLDGSSVQTASDDVRRQG